MGFDEFTRTFLNLESLAIVAPLLMQGALVSLQLILSIVPAALLLGILVAVAYDLSGPWARRAVIAYIDFLRSFPPLVLLILIYSCLPFLGIRLSEFATVVVALVANGSAFFGEIVRAGIESVGRG